MSIRPEVQEQLRSMFKQGATPSRLIQHIAACHPGEKHMHGLIVNYFLETFGVPFVHNLNHLDDYSEIGLKYAFLNDDVLHEMIQARATWDHDPSESSWLGSLTATNALDRIRDAESIKDGELSGCWDKLDEKERRAIQRILGGYMGKYEQIRILMRLAERLQQRINELEANQPDSSAGELVQNHRE